jgi:hypothetical protein
MPGGINTARFFDLHKKDTHDRNTLLAARDFTSFFRKNSDFPVTENRYLYLISWLVTSTLHPSHATDGHR